MHSFTVNCNIFSNEEKVAVVDLVSSIEATCSKAMLALSFSTLLVKLVKNKYICMSIQLSNQSYTLSQTLVHVIQWITVKVIKNI